MLVELQLKQQFQQYLEAVDENLVPCIIKIRGLKGGHSGMEIDKERGNSNKLMGRVLMSILSEIDFRLSFIKWWIKA